MKRKRGEDTAAAADADEPEEQPLTKGQKKSQQAATDNEERNEQLNAYLHVLGEMRSNKSVVVDTRLNFTYGLPKKARIPRTTQQWWSMQNLQGKLTNNYGQINIMSVRIENPLTYNDMQTVRADNNNFRYLNPEEYAAKARTLPRTVLLGSATSLAQHPNFTTHNFRAEVFPPSEEITEAEEANSPKRGSKSQASKKPGLQQEWIVWTRDKNGRKFPMTPATYADLKRLGYSRWSNETQSEEFHSESGWTIFCDEDRLFVIPKGWLPKIIPSAIPPPATDSLKTTL